MCLITYVETIDEASPMRKITENPTTCIVNAQTINRWIVTSSIFRDRVKALRWVFPVVNIPRRMLRVILDRSISQLPPRSAMTYSRAGLFRGCGSWFRGRSSIQRRRSQSRAILYHEFSRHFRLQNRSICIAMFSRAGENKPKRSNNDMEGLRLWTEITRLLGRC